MVGKNDSEHAEGLRLAIILLSLFLGTFLVAIDTTIVSVAIPEISTDFHSLGDVGWYGSAYLISITALQPVMGTIYKLFNVKLVYLGAIVVFEAGSTLCAAAPSSPLFILGRAIAGTGAAGLIQGAITVITYVSKLEKRPLFIGLVVSSFGICACFSPILGGVLTQRASWRWCFWINLPIGLVVFVLIFLGLSNKVKKDRRRKMPFTEKLMLLDPVGVILLLGSWWLGDIATIPPRIVKERTVSFGALALFLISMSSNIKMYYLPFYFQAAQGSSTVASGVRFLALAAPQVVATVLAGGIATKSGHYFPIMLVGQIICSVGTGLLIMIGTTTATAIWATFMVIAGFGDGMCTNMPYTAIQALLENEEDVFVGNAIATFATLGGGAIGVSIGENLLVNKLIEQVPKYTNTISPQTVIGNGALNLDKLTSSPSVLNGLRRAYSTAVSSTTICATVAICLSILATFGMRRLNLVKVSHEKEEAKAVPKNTRSERKDIVSHVVYVT
ncbi:MAG: hypothetical protein M1828_003656 [Chrysothrix sp. TS-e1954]|nr:MAG: hypothetical protein M1828_003656 [Chrysothrix sp. TS-e1954]